MQLRPASQGERAPLTTAPYSLGEAAAKTTPRAVTTLASARALRSVSAPINPALAARDLALAPRREIPMPAANHPRKEEIQERDFVVGRFADATLFVDGASPFDFDQMSAGDCWILSAMDALAVTEPSLFANAIRDNGDGTYTVRLYKDGKPLDIDIDDRFYMQRILRKAVYARPRGDSQEIWGPLVEKAYASLSPEGYDGIYGGFPVDAFRTLTGRESDIDLHATTSEDKLFGDTVSALANKRAAVVFTVDDTPDKQLEQNHLQATHAYAVIGTAVEGNDRFVILRNTSDRPEMRTDKYDAEFDAHVPPGNVPDGMDGAFKVRIDDYKTLFYSTTFVRAASESKR